MTLSSFSKTFHDLPGMENGPQNSITFQY